MSTSNSLKSSSFKHPIRCDFCDAIWTDCTKCILPDLDGGCKATFYVCEKHAHKKFCLQCLGYKKTKHHSLIQKSKDVNKEQNFHI